MVAWSFGGLVVWFFPSWKGCGRAEDGRRFFNPVALPRRSATALEQLGCQVDWWMDGLSGGPDSCPKRPPKNHTKIAISGCPNQQFWESRELPWRSRCLPQRTPKPIQNLQFRVPEISNFGGLGGSRGGLGVVLGAPGESRGAWRAPGGLPGGSRGAPGGLPGGSRRAPGGLPGAPGWPWRSRRGSRFFL